MKKVLVYFSLISAILILFSACHDLNTAERQDSPAVTQTPEDGYGVLRIKFAKDYVTPKLLIQPYVTTGDKILLKATSSNDTIEKNGTYGEAFSVFLKLNVEYEINTDVLK